MLRRVNVAGRLAAVCSSSAVASCHPTTSWKAVSGASPIQQVRGAFSGLGGVETTGQTPGGYSGPQVSFDGRLFLKTGSIVVNHFNFQSEVREEQNLPVLVYFHTKSSVGVEKYSQLLIDQVDKANREFMRQNVANGAEIALHLPNNTQILALKLALCDIDQYPLLAKEFETDTSRFPQVIFMHKGLVMDRMVGIVDEAQAKHAVNALVQYMIEEVDKLNIAKKAPGARLKFLGTDDENVLTMIHTAGKQLMDVKGDPMKAERLFERAKEVAEERVEELKRELGLDKKRETPEIVAELRRDPHYDARASAAAGLVAVALARRQTDRAILMGQELRQEYPWAVGELPDVAKVVVNVDLIALVGCKEDVFTERTVAPYLTYMPPEAEQDVVAFYKHKLLCAAVMFLHDKFEAAMEEVLKLIRSELKCKKQLIEGGVIPPPKPDASSSHIASSPARTAIKLMMEGVGATHQLSNLARKRLAQIT